MAVVGNGRVAGDRTLVDAQLSVQVLQLPTEEEEGEEDARLHPAGGQQQPLTAP